MKALKSVLEKLNKDKRRITWNNLLIELEILVPSGIYSEIKEIIDNRKQKLKNVKLK